MIRTLLSPRRLLLAGSIAAAALGAASTAHAGVLVATATNCDDQVLEQPFTPWLDPAQYVLAPAGDLSGGAEGWQLSGAQVVAENEPYYVHGGDEAAALRLDAGDSAITPSMCVGLLHPTLRFFARNAGGLLGSLRVDVLFEDATGAVQTLTIGRLADDGDWSPSLPAVVGANLLALLPGNRTPLAFRFTATGPGSSWLIDDVYVDPYGKG